MAQRTATRAIRFTGTVSTVGTTTIVRLPQPASDKLPSRGQVAVRGSMNGRAFATVLEPDGEFGHWMKLERALLRSSGVHSGDTVRVEVEPASEWPEPVVPRDLEAALQAAPQRIRDVWRSITPMARWEWVRWVNATNNPETRQRRVEVSIAKMDNGKRRPCCFNLASCTDPSLARNGRLVDAG